MSLETVERMRKRREEGENYSSPSLSSNVGRLDTRRVSSTLNGMSSVLDNMYGGWQDERTMLGNKVKLSTAQKELSDYVNTYNNSFDNDSRNYYNSLLNSYNKALSDWDSMSKVYGNYINADAYNKAKKGWEIEDKYKGKSYDDIQKALATTTDRDEQNYLKNYTSYSNKDDYEKAIKKTTDGSQLKALKNAYSNYSTMHAFDEYKDILNAKDFSKYSDPTKLLNTEMGLDENGKTTLTPMKERYGGDVMDRGKGSDMYNKVWLSELPEDMQKVAAYLYQNPEYGADAYKDFINKVSIQASAENSEERSKAWTDWTNKNPLTGIVGTLVNTVSRPIEYTGATLEEGVSALTGAEYNPYRGFAGWGRDINASQAALGESVENTLGILGKIGYNALTEGATSRIGQMATGNLYNIVMGGGVFAQTYGDALLSGMGKEQALGKAAAAGAIETLTEMAGMESAFKKFPDKKWWQTALKQMLPEAGEEVLGNLGNLAYDLIANGKDAEMRGDAQNYMAQGYDEKTAWKMAIGKFALDTAEEAATAALSVAPMAGVSAIATTERGKRVDFKALGEAVAKFSENSKARQNYESLQNQYGENVPNWNKGAVFNQAVNETVADYQKAEKELKKANKRGTEEDIIAAKENVQSAKDRYRSLEDSYGRIRSEQLNEALNSRVTEEDIKKYQTEQRKNTTYTEDVQRVYDKFNTSDNEELYKAHFDIIKDKADQGFTMTDEDLDQIPQAAMGRVQAMDIYDALTENNGMEQRAFEGENNKVVGKWDLKLRSGKFDDSQLKNVRLNKDERKFIGLVQTTGAPFGANINLIKDSNLAKNGMVNLDKDGTITINLAAKYRKSDKANLQQAIATLAHERTHYNKSLLGAEWNGYLREVKKYMGEARWNQALSRQLSRMKADPNNLTQEQIDAAEEEIVAHFNERFTDDEAWVKDFLSKIPQNTVQKFLDTVKAKMDAMFADIRALIKKANFTSPFAKELVEDMTEEAYNHFKELNDKLNVRATELRQVQLQEREENSEDSKNIVDNEASEADNEVRNSDQLADMSAEEIEDAIRHGGYAYSEKEISRGAKALEGILAKLGKGDLYRGGRNWRTVALGITNDFARFGRIDWNGRRISTDDKEAARELATYAMILRNPGFETSRIFYTKGDEIVGNDAYTSYAVEATGSSSFETSEAFHKDIEDKMKKYGADGFFLLHNHPSGSIVPSGITSNRGDISATLSLAKISGFRKHIIIDHNKFSVIDKNGDWYRRRLEGGNAVDYRQKVINHRLLYQSIATDEDYGKASLSLVHNKEHSAIMHIRNNGKGGNEIARIDEVYNGFIKSDDDFAKYLITSKAQSGSRRLVLCTGDNEIFTHPAIKELVEHNILSDVVNTDRLETYKDNGIVSDTDKYVSNGQEKGKLKTYDLNARDVKYSDQLDDTDLIAEIFGNTEEVKKRKVLRRDELSRLKRLLKIQGVETGGKVLNEERIIAVAKELKRLVNSNYDLDELTQDIDDAYHEAVRLIHSGEENLDNKIMTLFRDVATNILNEQKPTVEYDPYYRNAMNSLRQMKVNLTEGQIKALKERYGNDWHNATMGKFIYAKNGRNLDSVWSELVDQYPTLFDADTAASDMGLALIEAYETARDSSEIEQSYQTAEDLEAFTEEVYNKFFTVNALETVADKYAAEKNTLMREHREAMSQLKDSHKKALAKIKRRDATIKRVREQGKQKLAEYKKYRNALEEGKKERALRRDFIKKIKETSHKLEKTLNKNAVKEPIIEPLKGLVSDFISAIDFSSQQSLGMRGNESKRGKSTQNDRDMMKALKGLRNFMTGEELSAELEKVRDYVGLTDDSFGFGEYFANRWNAFTNRVLELADMRQAENTYVLNQMTSEELKTLNDMMKELTTVVTEANNLIGGAAEVKINEIRSEDISELNKIGEAKDKTELGQRLSNFLNWAQSLPEYAMKHIGKGASLIFDEMKDGMDKEGFLQKRIREFAEETFVNDRNADEENVNDVVLNEGTDKEMRFRMTDAQIMNLYVLYQREQAQPHVEEGGIRIRKFKTKNGKIVDKTGKHKLTADEVNYMANEYLTEEQRNRADAMQKWLADFSKENVNEVTLKMVGIEIANDPHYWPIEVVKDGNEELSERAKEEGIYKLLNSSFANPLMDNAQNPVAIGSIYDVFIRNASETAKYNCYALPMRDMIRYITGKNYVGNGEVENMYDALKATYGDAAYQYVIDFLKDLGGLQQAGRGEEYIGVRNYKIAQVAANLQVAALQPIAISRAALCIDRRYILASIGSLWNIKHGIDTMHANSGVSLIKESSTFDINLSRGLNRELRKMSVKDKIVDNSTKLASAMDTITWGAIWNACEMEYKSKHGVSTISEEGLKEVNKKFREIVFNSQVMDSVLTRSDLMRSQSKAVQYLTSFMSEPTMTYNIMQDAAFEYANDARKYGKGEALRRNGKKIAKATEIYVVSAVIEGALRGLMGKWRGKDEDKDELEYWWSQVIDQLNPLNQIPFGRDVVSLLQGYDVNRMDMQPIATFITAGKRWAKIAKDDKEIDYKTVYATLQAVSQMTGIPISNALREVINLWNNTIALAYPSLEVK